MVTEITQKDLHDLLEIFEKKAFEAGQCEEGSSDFQITKQCESLFKLDYSLIELDNSNGALSTRYPEKILIPEYEKHQTNGFNGGCVANGIQSYVTFGNVIEQKKIIYEDLYDTNKIRELITMAKYARCRQRFCIPVIMYKGKYICRSATISVMPEAYGRKLVDFTYDCFNGTNNYTTNYEDENNDVTDESLITNNETSPFSYSEVIKSDIQLLKTLNVSTIVDLMVEQRKIKYFMTVSSSEKADPENHYENFNILSLPYPGCEFFKKFRDNNYMAKNLHYNWKQSFIDATLNLPKSGPAYDIDVNWFEYNKWDLIQITQNYLKATLKYIQEENSGILIHCISGWDRTPLFVSLVRLSLWADGLIHQSMNAIQMAYFTLAYDWYLFGHQLPDRLKRGEDIMFFCFHVLKYLTDDEFSLIEHRSKTSPISVPGVSACRQRQESTSSNGSWQVVTETGSIDSIMNGSYMMRFIQQETNGSSNSSNTAKEIKSITSLRKQRLNAVRAIFIQAYGKTIGLRFKEGSAMNLATFIGTIADQLF